MINECFISPNNIFIDLAEIVVLNVLYMVYMCHSIQRNRAKFNSSQTRMLLVIGALLTINALTIFSVTVAKVVMNARYGDLTDDEVVRIFGTLEHVRGLSNFLSYQTINLLFLLWLFNFQLIEIQMDENNEAVLGVLKRIQETQRSAKCVLFALLLFEILFLVFQTSMNIFEIYDFGAAKG